MWIYIYISSGCDPLDACLESGSKEGIVVLLQFYPSLLRRLVALAPNRVPEDKVRIIYVKLYEDIDRRIIKENGCNCGDT